VTARYFIAQWVDDDDGWSIAVATSAREALGETCSLIDEHAECRRDVEPRSFAQLMRVKACTDCGSSLSIDAATGYVCESCEAAVVCFSCFVKYKGCKTCDSPGAPYRVQLCEVAPAKLSSLVDLTDDEDGEPRRAWEVLESAAFNAGGATEYYPADELTGKQDDELNRILALRPAEARATALDAFAEKVWSFGWWNVLRVDGARREVEITLSADTDTWDAALPEWAK
jgi:hypothetical protein